MTRRPITFYKPKFNRLMSILIPTHKDCLDAWNNGQSNRWLAREINEQVLDEIISLPFQQKIKLAWDILRM